MSRDVMNIKVSSAYEGSGPLINLIRDRSSHLDGPVSDVYDNDVLGEMRFKGIHRGSETTFASILSTAKKGGTNASSLMEIYIKENNIVI